MRPLEQQGAQAAMEELVRLWRRNLDEPLPVACKAALAQLLDDDPRVVYDGGFEIAGEVEQDECLARLWPEFALLQQAAGNWAGMAHEMYGALVQWMHEDIEIQPHEGEPQ
jgi:exodeoxyribonuclease V gamma subunit